MNQPALSYIKYIYDSAIHSEFNYTFTPLTQNTDYTIYYVIGNENPFESIATSEVKAINFKTKESIDVG